MRRLALLIVVACFTVIAADSPAHSENLEQENVFPEKKAVSFKEIKRELRKKKPKTEKFLGQYLEVSFKVDELNKVSNHGYYIAVRFYEDDWTFAFIRPFVYNDYMKFKNATTPEKVGGYICKINDKVITFTDDPILYKKLTPPKTVPEPKDFKR